MQEKLIQIMSTIFEVDVNSINLETTMEDIHSWDSMNHMNLILSIEEEFKIKIEDETALELLSLRAIVDYLSKRK